MTQASGVQTLVDQAAHVLVDARKAGDLITNLPESCRPADIDTALAIQNRVTELMGETVGGWKCGLLPKPEMVMLAPVLKSTLFRTSPVQVVGAPGKIEPEVAFVLGKDIAPRSTPYTNDEIRSFIGESRFVLELLGARYKNTVDVTYPELLADSYNNYGLFIGPAIPGALDRPLESLQVKITSPSATIVEREGKHPSGHPMKSFAWLVNYLSARGVTMKAGEVVTTGSYAGVVEVPIGEPITVVLSDFGTIEIKLTN